MPYLLIICVASAVPVKLFLEQASKSIASSNVDHFGPVVGLSRFEHYMKISSTILPLILLSMIVILLAVNSYF